MEREIKASDLYIEGLKEIVKSRSIDLDEAARVAREDAILGKGDEHLPYIEAAYNYLKSLEIK